MNPPRRPWQDSGSTGIAGVVLVLGGVWSGVVLGEWARAGACAGIGAVLLGWSWLLWRSQD